MARFPRIVGALLLGAVSGLLAVAAPAAAHTGITIEPKVAGAADAVATISAQAESTTAGIASIKVVLPAGIAPADVSYVDGPAGWSLAPDADGYTVGGPALPVGRDARHRVRIRQLPATPTLAFKMLQTYTDGRVDRWIELPAAGQPEPEFPAPVVTLNPPPGGFPSPSVSPSASPSVPSPTGIASSADVVQEPVNAVSNAGPAVPWLIAAVVAVGLGVAATVVLRRRRSRAGTTGTG